MSPTAEEIAAGQAFYTDRTLPNYDLRVLTLSNPLIWRCPTTRLLQFFNAHVSANHLDIGVGSGYYTLTHWKAEEKGCRRTDNGFV